MPRDAQKERRNAAAVREQILTLIFVSQKKRDKKTETLLFTPPNIGFGGRAQISGAPTWGRPQRHAHGARRRAGVMRIHHDKPMISGKRAFISFLVILSGCKAKPKGTAENWRRNHLCRVWRRRVGETSRAVGTWNAKTTSFITQDHLNVKCSCICCGTNPAVPHLTVAKSPLHKSLCRIGGLFKTP